MPIIIDEKIIFRTKIMSNLNLKYFFEIIEIIVLIRINEKRVAIAAPKIPISGIKIKFSVRFERADKN